MSPELEGLANSSTAAGSTEPSLCLTGLIEILHAQITPPSLEQLCSWLREVQITDNELRPYLGFKEGTYWRHLVCRNEAVEMLVLCWKPGQRTVIHDHNGSQGAVLVQQGVVWETLFTFAEGRGLAYQSAREYAVGSITGAAVPDIHQLGNPDVSEQDLVTIHIYSPPLGVLHTYKSGSTLIDLYTPLEPD